MALKKRLDQLPAILGGDIENNDLMYLVHENENAETGYDSKKTTAADVGRKLLGGIEYVSELSNFPSGKQNGFDALEYLREFLIGQLPVITTSPSPIANFNTDMALPLKSLVAEIKATGGNGTPSTPVPIVGVSTANITHTGKNLVLGVITGGSIDSNGTIAGGSTQYDMVYAPIKAGETYTISTNETTNQFVGGYFTSLPSVGSTSYDGQRIVQYSKTFTAPITGYVVFRQMSGYEYAQLETGDQATTYEPYTATTYPISWQTEAGTVYGGSLDLVSGVLTVSNSDKKKIKDLTWTYNSTYQVFICTTEQSTIKKPSSNNTPLDGLLSESYKLSVGAPSNMNTGDIGANTSGNILVKDTDYSDVDIWKTAVGESYISYPLATPISIQLTPEEITAFLGSNNLWSDTNGDISASYRESIQKYVDEQIAATQALIL